jgi:two-component sensor histidine kinase
MPGDAVRIIKLLRQQAAIARFGSFALQQTDLMSVLTEAARVCADGLAVPYSKVCRYRPEHNDLLVEAGYGWKPGIVGYVTSRADLTTPQGRAFITGEPAACNDLRMDREFELPPVYAEYGITSTIDVVIKGSGLSYGVLEIGNNEQHDYDQHDIDFLTGFANVLAEAVGTSRRVLVLETTIQRMEILVQDKDRLLAQKNVLAEELQHRVRNNLQLVYGMLNRQLSQTSDGAGQKGIRAIGRRVSTLAQVYNHLLGEEMTRTTDFGKYVKLLCLNLADIQAVPASSIVLTCESERLDLALDVVTALGIVVAELVTNSYDHAFPDGQGTISLSVQRDVANPALAVLVVADDGISFIPKNGSKRVGLGLVRRLIEQIGGTVAVNTDHGTKWTMTFPTAAV